MVNKFILQGRLTADPEIKQTPSGVSCANFTVAWSEKYKEIETKCIQRCKAWRSTADFIGKYFAKGQEIIVVGKMATESWEKDGQKYSAQVLTVDEASFCGSKSANQGEAAPAQAYTPPAAQTMPGGTPQFEEVGDDDQLPF